MSIPCPICKGEVKIIDLGEEVMRSALCRDGKVKWVEENEVLKEHDGVCAFLQMSLNLLEERKERQDVC